MIAKSFKSLCACVLLLMPMAVLGQVKDYPSKPLRIIIPFSPGGTNDILARMVATHLNVEYGQVVVPDNRPGYQGIIGTELAVKADPDGYTMAVISAAYTMNPATLKMPFDPVKSLDFVVRIGQSFLIMTAGPRIPAVKSIQDLVATAKKRPGEIVLSTSGGFMYFATSLFASLSKEKFNIVQYKGGFPAMMDVIGGQVDGGFAVSTYALANVRAGKIRPLAVGTLKRSDLLPDVPTLDEAGIKGYDASNWYAIAVPAGTPRAIVMQLHKDIAGYFTSPEMVKKMATLGIVVDIKTPDEMKKIIPAEIRKWTQIAIETGMPRQK